MKAKSFDFNFKYQGDKYDANCTVMIFPKDSQPPLNKPMYRISVNLDKKKSPLVIVLYDNNPPHKNFSWFPSEKLEKMAISIGKALRELN